MRGSPVLLRQRIATVFDWAKAAGFLDGENPVAGVGKGLPRQPENKDYHAAMSVSDLPGFILDLRAADASEITKLALEFLILTAARTGEVLGAKWHKVNEEAGVWTIPSG